MPAFSLPFLGSFRLLLNRSLVYALLAQLVEQLTLNQRAQGSSPWKRTMKKELLLGVVLFPFDEVYVNHIGCDSLD